MSSSRCVYCHSHVPVWVDSCLLPGYATIEARSCWPPLLLLSLQPLRMPCFWPPLLLLSLPLLRMPCCDVHLACRTFNPGTSVMQHAPRGYRHCRRRKVPGPTQAFTHSSWEGVDRLTVAWYLKWQTHIVGGRVLTWERGEGCGSFHSPFNC